MYKISLIIPLYNDAPRVERCLDAVCCQTIIDHIEIIVVDDGSTDESVQIVKNTMDKWGRRDQLVQISVSSNKGVANARRIGVEKSSGKYIMFCDSDDWMDFTMCEKLLCKAERDSNDIVVCDYNSMDNGVIQNVKSYQEPFLERLLLWTVTGALWNKLFASKLLKNDRFKYPINDFSEDFVYCAQAAMNASNIGYVPEPLYYYYHRDGSIVRSTSYEKQQKRLNDDIANFELVIEILRENGLDKKYADEVIVHKWKIKNHYRNNVHLWKKAFPELNRDIFKTSLISWKSRLAYFATLLGLYEK